MASRGCGLTQKQGQAFSPSDLGMNLLGSTTFPQFGINTSDPTIQNGLEFGPSTSFGNAGMYQNQWEFESSLNMVKGRHTIAMGGQLDHAQLNIINNNTNTDTLEFYELYDLCGRAGAQRRCVRGFGKPLLPVQHRSACMSTITSKSAAI